MKKLVICKYIGFNPDKELCTVGTKYPYVISTKKKIETGDFICIAEPGVGNEDRNFLSTVRVLKIMDWTTDEEMEAEIEKETSKNPRNKLFIGKADLKGYFAELDKKRKIEELKNKIEARFKEAEKEALYRKLAETDPEMKALLSELDSLK